jgi:hypothetical protein
MKDKPLTKTSNESNIDRPKREPDASDSLTLLRELLEEMKIQTKHLSEIQFGVELDPCLLEKIGRIACMTANEVHAQTQQVIAIREAFEAFLEMYKCEHPAQALELEKLARLRAEMHRCCPPEEKKPAAICHYEPCKRGGGFTPGDGYSMKSKGFVSALPFSEKPHHPWKIALRIPNEEDEGLPVVAQGSIFGQLVPSAPTPRVMDYQSGGGSTPGAEEPVGFRTFTKTQLSANWPPDMSGARGGDVVVMSGNLWLKLSVDGGKTFTDLDWTQIFDNDTTYGGWAGDQVIHYVPALDCFVLYVQSFKAAKGANINKNVVKVALASQADLKKFAGGRQAWWRQWNFTSDTFGLGNSWMDFPDISYGDKFLYINTNVFAGQQGKLFFELPLADLQAGRGFNFQYAFISDEGKLSIGSPTQNIVGDENYWAAHVDNSTMRIYSSKGTEANFSWRERKISNWPKTSDNNIVSAAPDNADWLSEDHRIIGATRVNNVLWFAWTAATGDGGGGGFKFPQPHIQIAKFDLGQDYKLIEQTQVWNADHAYAYPSLTTNSDNEVGISLAWGGNVTLKYYGNHAVGILGDFVVWYGELSDITVLRQQVDSSGNLVVDSSGNPVMAQTRWGDYVHARLAYPDTRFFSAFGYAVRNDPTLAAPSKGSFDYLYVEFGREKLAPPPIK